MPKGDGAAKKEAADPQLGGLQAVARLDRGLSLPEIRRLLWCLVLQVPRGVRRILAWSHGRYHQWVALYCHHRRQQLKRQHVQL